MQASNSPRPRLRALKFLQIANHFRHALFLVVVRFPGATQQRIGQHFQQWCLQVLRTLQIPVQCNRAPPVGFAGLVVCNHLSWLDILVLQTLMPGSFVAKKEVRSWPLVGYLAAACSTIFVDRGSRHSARHMVERTAEAIRQGSAVVVFPEGTSTDGSSLGAFHANIFESAIRAGSGVQLVTLQYRDARTGKAAEDAHYIGEMSFVSSLWRVMGSASITATVHIGECIAAQGQSRKALAQQAFEGIRSQLQAEV